TRDLRLTRSHREIAADAVARRRFAGPQWVRVGKRRRHVVARRLPFSRWAGAGVYLLSVLNLSALTALPSFDSWAGGELHRNCTEMAAKLAANLGLSDL